MLEGVLKVMAGCICPIARWKSFNPWYVGGGVKRLRKSGGVIDAILVSILGMLEGVLKARELNSRTAKHDCFNPWYVGGGVKSWARSTPRAWKRVSILGMLEGVLKVVDEMMEKWGQRSFNPWYVGGGVKSHFGHNLRGI